MRQAGNDAIGDWIGEAGEYDRYLVGGLLERPCGRCVCRQDHIRREVYQFRRKGFGPLCIAATPANSEADVATFHPIQVMKAPLECRQARLAVRFLRGTHQHRDAPDSALLLLRTRDDRPCGRATENRNKPASPHAMLPGIIVAFY